MATASAAQACTPSRVSRSVAAKPQAPAGNHANANAQRFGFSERADFAIFGGDVAMADVHHAHVGVGSAAALGRLDRQTGQVLHHGWQKGPAEECRLERVPMKQVKGLMTILIGRVSIRKSVISDPSASLRESS